MTSEELRNTLANLLREREIGFSMANANGRAAEQMVTELIDGLVAIATEYTAQKCKEARIDELETIKYTINPKRVITENGIRYVDDRIAELNGSERE